MEKRFSLEDLKSGYVVKLRDGSLRMVMRVGRFTKILVNGFVEGKWDYLSCWNNDLMRKFEPTNYPDIQRRHKASDIIEVYGLIQGSDNYDEALSLSTENRELLWSRKKVVRMTLAEVCKKLGYEVELIPEEE